MKRIIITLVSVLALLNTVSAQKIKGSDTVLPLAQKEAEVFMKKNKAARITVTGGGSGVGISSLIDNTTDIAMSSRKMKLSEKMKVNEGGSTSTEVTIAFDALAVIVNPANKVSQLTREQLEGIFTGKIKNWNQVGGDNMSIVVYGRESSSGTYDFFKEHVLNNKNYASNVLSMPATGAIVQSVSQTKGAIGYVGLAYVENNVKALGVSFNKGKTFVTPSVASAKDKTYPIVRPLFFYYLAASSKMVKPFVDFILSAEGQAIVSKEGFITIK
ncbi:MAG: phosphate ABC transporter substrate-binding protein [Bacteroidetes bacterium B1(2017)]|nr:MAG: phosphate ABC transporter substrate-binding protein [Bacteroidetes bacterium B1(2017)]